MTFLAGYIFWDVDVVTQSPWAVGCERSYSGATAKARMGTNSETITVVEILSQRVYLTARRAQSGLLVKTAARSTRCKTAARPCSTAKGDAS
jgi:hypothetical protein